MREEVARELLKEKRLVVTQDGVPVVPHVELFVGLARVAFVDGDEFVVTRVLGEEVACRRQC